MDVVGLRIIFFKAALQKTGGCSSVSAHFKHLFTTFNSTTGTEAGGLWIPSPPSPRLSQGHV